MIKLLVFPLYIIVLVTNIEDRFNNNNNNNNKTSLVRSPLHHSQSFKYPWPPSPAQNTANKAFIRIEDKQINNKSSCFSSSGNPDIQDSLFNQTLYNWQENESFIRLCFTVSVRVHVQYLDTTTTFKQELDVLFAIHTESWNIILLGHSQIKSRFLGRLHSCTGCYRGYSEMIMFLAPTIQEYLAMQ